MFIQSEQQGLAWRRPFSREWYWRLLSGSWVPLVFCVYFPLPCLFMSSLSFCLYVVVCVFWSDLLFIPCVQLFLVIVRFTFPLLPCCCLLLHALLCHFSLSSLSLPSPPPSQLISSQSQSTIPAITPSI